ncbi:Nrap protein [Lasiosphaeria miniovina]|uniref:U3 small nucleolar RNA-associated protein 22 n=1 Tax=Lasiosphaeria miniovina TaxID=1954250 RepID=A0AA40ABZ4_9PEZI|nr:Nrap protein [Lasiosphaeria miniovina]KAK0713071.1 Nrap protein [Lasiosphaeria miniovina]
MESTSPKRRKLDHGDEGAHKVLISGVSTRFSRSRAFILEAEELLEEVRLDHTVALEGVDDLLHRIKGIVEAIKPHEPRLIIEAASKLEKKSRIIVPFPEPRPKDDSHLKASFAKPPQFNVVGSYVSKTMAKTQKAHAVDMVVVMPTEIFQDKDYLDLRYFHKRAYYLAVIAAALQKDLGGEARLSFENLNGNPLSPILSIQPKIPTKVSKNGPKVSDSTEASDPLDYRIQVIPCLPDALFPKAKLHLGAALLRKACEEAADVSAQSTPFYNSTLTAEGCFLPYLRVMRQTEKKCAAFKNACILGRVWLQQRGFDGSIPDGGFGHFEWALLLALLLQSDRSGNATLSASLSSTQLFKALIQFLSAINFAETPIFLGNGNEDVNSATQACPVIYDSSRQLNIAFKMSPWSAALLHRHAKWTRAVLSNNAVDQFSPTFILKADIPLHNFDFIARLNYDGSSMEAPGTDSRGRVWRFGEKVYRVLKKALADSELGERARLIHIKTPESSSWSLTGSPDLKGIATLEIGILFDTVNMARTVDRGPSAGPTTEEKEECENFRQFWGEKSELRRFERDSIRETLIWTSTSPFGLCEEIVRYILKLHTGIGHIHQELTVDGDGLSDLIPLKSTDTAMFNAARKAFSTFEQDLRELDNLPLHVRQLAPICAELRHTSIKPPSLEPPKSKFGPQPMETVISFEASGKWPENIVAIQRTKVAFLLMIGSLLEKSKVGQVKTYLGLEDAKYESENLAFLDVVYDSGASFRLRIHSDLEETLLERQVKDKTLEQHVRSKATTLLAKLRRLYTNLPLHNQAMTTFAARFPAFSPSVRLVKHWFNAHKLSCHFTDEFLELAVLHVFLSPYPWDAPSSASTGFLRTLLFLAHWDWRSDPLIVDTSGDMSAADRVAIETRLEAWRKLDPNMNHTVIFVATGQESNGIAYTVLAGEAKPSKVVAARMTALAKSACRAIREQDVSLDARRLFVPSLNDYDVLIRLNGKTIKNASITYITGESEESKSIGRSKFKNLDERTGRDPLPLTQHPAEVFLKQLNAAYSGPLVFFRGVVRDTTIGAIWNPQMQRRSFKVNLPTSYKPVGREPGQKVSLTGMEDNPEEHEEVLIVNKEAILAEIARIGAELIESIDVKGQ